MHSTTAILLFNRIVSPPYTTVSLKIKNNHRVWVKWLCGNWLELSPKIAFSTKTVPECHSFYSYQSMETLAPGWGKSTKFWKNQNYMFLLSFLPDRPIKVPNRNLREISDRTSLNYRFNHKFFVFVWEYYRIFPHKDEDQLSRANAIKSLCLWFCFVFIIVLHPHLPEHLLDTNN